MSRHENVSCDLCLKSNFKGLRYKCLLCFDYDLCNKCYESSDVRTNRGHSKNHPMQVLITRHDFDLYYGGEITDGRIQSYTCPLCSVMGWSQQGLVDHVGSDHYETFMDVLCPICIALNIREPNVVTDYLAGHISLEHSGQTRETAQENSNRPEIRRIPPALYRSTRSHRNLRTLVNSRLSNFTTLVSSLDNVDPISQLISHLSGRSSDGSIAPVECSTPVLERVQTKRKNLQSVRAVAPTVLHPVPNPEKPPPDNPGHKFVCKISEPLVSEESLQTADRLRADRSHFVQEIFLSAIFKRENNLSQLINVKTPSNPTCYKRVMDETMEMQDKIQEELRLDPVDKEVAVIYQGEQGDASNQFYKGKRIVEMDKERPPWFSRNLLQRSADPSEPAPDLKPKDLA